MADDIFNSDSPLLGHVDQNLVNKALDRAGAFTPDTNVPVSDGSGAATLNAVFSANQRVLDQYNQTVATQQQNAVLAQMAAQKRQELADAQRLQSLAQYRKDPLQYNPDGTLAQDSNAELMLKQGANKLADWWNDVTPDVVHINSRLTGTVAGMQNEDLGNKNIISNEGRTKQDVINEANKLQDNPNGQGTLYYLRRNIGTQADPNYIYKVGFAALDAADRYRSQAGFAGWEIVKEVQNSDASKTEQDVHAMNMDSRLLSYGQIKGADGKMHNHDDASGINFGVGYGEIYNKDILGWDKKSTQQDVNNYKSTVLQQAISSGQTPVQIAKINKTLNNITPDSLDNIKYSNNLTNSIAKRDENDEYVNKHGKSDMWTGFKVGLDQAGRQFADATLDAITPDGLDPNSFAGKILESDGHGNSKLLDNWKSTQQVEDDFHYNSRKGNQAVDALTQHTKDGDYIGALGDIFSKNMWTVTANNLGYFAPVILGAAIGSLATGGAGDVAAVAGLGADAVEGGTVAAEAAEAGGIASKIKSGYQAMSSAMNEMKAAKATGDAESLASAGENLTAAKAVIQSSIKGYGSTLQNAAKLADRMGFYGEAVAMSNERIDERIKNNGGKPTSLLENGGVFLETIMENALDKYMELETLGAPGHKQLQNIYKALEVNGKQHVITSIATKALEIMASSGLEGTTEYIQNTMQSFAEQYDTKKNNGTIEGILSSKENKEDNLVNFLMGVASGMHMQTVPTAGRAAMYTAKSALYNSPFGSKKYDQMMQNKQDLSELVSSGSASPYDASTTSFSGDSPISAKNDIYDLSTHQDELPLQVAKYAILGTQAQIQSEPQNYVNAEGKIVVGEQTDAHIDASKQAEEHKAKLYSTVDGINSSLKNTYNIDNDPTDTEKAQYQTGMYTSALNAMKRVVYTDQTIRALGGDKPIDVNAKQAKDAMSNVIDAYSKYLSPDDKAQIQLMIANEVNNHIKAQASKTNANAKNIDMSVLGENSVINKDYSLNIDELHKALSTIETLKLHMGSMNNGTTGDSKASNGGSGFEDAARESINAFYYHLKGAYNKAKDAGEQDVHLDQEFFDKAKTFSQVGSEILMHGKRNADGTTNGSGILQHSANIINEISNTSHDSSINRTPLNTSAVGSAKTFSDSMLKLHDMHNIDSVKVNENDLGKIYTNSEVRNVTKEDSIKANYIPQLDVTGRIVRSKIFEANTFKKEMERAKIVLQSYIEQLASEKKVNDVALSAARNYMVILDGIIATQEHNIATLQTYMVDENRLSSEGRVLEDISRNSKYKDVVNAIRSNDSNDNKFRNEKSSIYAFVDKHTSSGSKNQNIFDHKESNSHDDNLWHDGETTEKPNEKPAISETKDETGNNNESKETNSNTTKDGEIKDGQKLQGSEQQSEPGENTKTPESSEDAKDDERKTEKPIGTSEGTQGLNNKFTPVEEFRDKALAIAEQKVQEHHVESIGLMNELASNAGIEDFEYNENENIAYNIRAIRKAITSRINETKKKVRKYFTEDISSELNKVEQLAKLIDSAILADKESRTALTLKNNPDLNEHNLFIRKVKKLSLLIDANKNDPVKLKANLSSLTRLLRIVVPDNIKKSVVPYYKQIAEQLSDGIYTKATNSSKEKNLSTSDIAELDIIKPATQAMIDELNEEIAKLSTNGSEVKNSNIIQYTEQPEPHTEEAVKETDGNVNVDIDETPLNEIETGFVSQEAVDNLFDDKTVNIFETEESKKELESIRNSIFAKQKELLAIMSGSKEALENVTDAHNSMDSGLTPEEQVRLYELYTKRIQERNNSDIRNCK